MALMRLARRARLTLPRGMKRRRNPDPFDYEAPPLPSGFSEAKMKESLQFFNRELSTALRNLEREAVRLRVRPEDLPTQTNRLIGQEVQTARYLLTAASHPELAEYAYFQEDEDDLAEKLFPFTLTLLRAYEEPEIKELAEAWKQQIAERICELRAPVRAHFAQYTGEDPERDCRVRPKTARRAAPPPPVRPSPAEELEDMSDDELEALIRAEEGGDDEEDVRPEPVRPAARPVVPVAPARADKKKPTDTGYKDYIVKTRVRVPGQPSDALMANARGDVLVFRLSDGNAQVWVKGALTLTFTHSRGRSSSKIGALYANEWRKEGGKKREKCRILFAVEGSDDFTVVAPSLAEIAAAKPRREVSAEREIDDLKRMDLRNNPDWQALFGRAKKKGAEGAAAAQLAARRAAHDAKVLATKARIAAERQRVRSSYRVLGLSLLEARDGRYQQEMNALDEIMGGEVGDSLYPSAFGSQRRHREGFFAMEDELKALEKSRPNPKRNRRR